MLHEFPLTSDLYTIMFTDPDVYFFLAFFFFFQSNISFVTGQTSQITYFFTELADSLSSSTGSSLLLVIRIVLGQYVFLYSVEVLFNAVTIWERVNNGDPICS